MKRLLIVLWLAALCGSAAAQCPIKAATEKIVKPLICLDTLGRSATPDSAHITTYKDDASFATYFARSTTFPFTAASIDTTRPAIGGTAPVLYWLSETISTIDGTASNATLAINVQLWWKGYATDNMFCVQMVPDSLSDVIWRLALATAAPAATTSDSAKVSGTALSGLNNVIKTNSFAAGAIDDNAMADGAVDWGGELDSTGSATSVWSHGTRGLAAAGNASIADSVWGVAFTGGTSNVAAVTGSIGDSLNNSSYVGIVDWAKVNNATTTVNLSGTTVGTLTTNSDKTGYALTVAPLDSATTSRILGRKIWGVAAGTGSDSVAATARYVTSAAGTGLDSATTSRILGRKIWGIAAGTGSDSVAWANRTASTSAGTGLDSATTSRIIKRTVWGIASGTGADSTAIAERKAGTVVTTNTATALTTNNDKTGYTASTVSDKTGYSLSTAGNASVADSVWGVAFTGGSSNVAAVTGSIGDSLNNTSYVGVVDWAKVNNATTTVGLTNTTIGTLTTNSDKTGYTVSTVSDKTGYSLSSSYPDSSMLSRVLGRKIWGVAAGTGADSVAATARYVTSAAGTGLDSATTSRIIKRTVWGVASGTGSDSTTKAQRVTGPNPAWDTLNTFAYVTPLDSAATSRIVGRKVWGVAAGTGSDSVAWSSRTASTAAGTGLDSATTSRIIRRTVWGMPLGTGSDSTAIAERKVGTVVTTNTATALTTNNDKTGYALSTAGNASVADSVWGVAFTGGTSNVGAVTGSVGDSLNNSSYVGIVDWAKVNNPTSTVSLTNTTVSTVTTTTTATTAGLATGTLASIADSVWGVAYTGGTSNVGAVTGSIGDSINNGYFGLLSGIVDSTKMSRILGRKIWGVAAGTGSDSVAATARFVTSAAGTGLDSATTSRIIGRKVWGIAAGTGADSVAATLRYATSAAGSGLDSATTSRIVKRATWGVGGGSSGSDSTTLAQRTATATGSVSVTASIYPLMQIATVVDNPGTLTRYQFVIDTTAAGSSNEYALLNRAVTLRDTSTSWGKPYFNGIIERANCVADNCTLQVSDSCSFPIAKGDSLWIWNGGPQYVMATLPEAAAAQADTLLGRDSTGQSAGTIGQAIVDGGTGGSDTTANKLMLQNMGLTVGLDSLAKLSQNTTSAGTLRRGEVPTLTETGDTLAGRIPDSTFAKGGVVDTARNASGLTSGGSGGCPDSGGFAVQIFAKDTSNSVMVEDAIIRTKASINGVVTGKAETGPSGSFLFSMNAGKHYLFTQAYGMTFRVDSVTVAGNMVDTVFGAERAAVPGMTTIFGRVTSSGGEALAGASVELELTNYDDTLLYVAGGEQIVPVISRATVDENGDWAIAVYANGAFDPKSRYTLRIKHPDANFVPRLLHAVPDTININVKDLY